MHSRPKLFDIMLSFKFIIWVNSINLEISPILKANYPTNFKV